MTDKSFIDALVKLFGAEFDAPETKAFFKEWKFDEEFDPDMFPYRFIEDHSRGISLQFAHSESDDDDAKPAYAFCGAFFYDEGIDGFSKFQGALPSGIAFSDTRKQVRTKLGKPSFSGPSLDRWDSKDQSLAVDYTSDQDESVMIVNLSTKFEP